MSESIPCTAGCKRAFVPALDGSAAPGWEQLQITGRWRCGACSRELTAANHLPGTSAEYTPDPLPPHSIGALKSLPEPPPLREEVK